MRALSKKFFIVAAIAGFFVVPSRALEGVIRSVKTASVPGDPNDSAWKKAKPVTIPLSPQSLVSPHGGGSVAWLEVQSLYSEEEIGFRLKWIDATKDSSWDLTNRFVDACAVQFPVQDQGIPSPLMGDRENPVNIWRWSAIFEEKNRYPKAYADFHRQDAIETAIELQEMPGENLMAQGFGTLTKDETQDIRAAGSWTKNGWTVVLKRSLKTKGSGASFKQNTVVPMAFALWNGSQKERDGMKSVGFWQWLVIGKGEPPKSADPVKRGETVFARYGCATCHGAGGKGGVENPNATGGLVPPINRVSEGFTEDELEAVIRDGRPQPQKEDQDAPLPQLKMNAWKTVLDHQEIDDLVKYLFSLLSKDQKEEW